MVPRVQVESILSDASTLPWDISGDVEDADDHDDTGFSMTGTDWEVPGEVVSDLDSLSSLSGDEEGYSEDAPTRDDRPIETGRWQPQEVEALMTAINVNRDAIKFHFVGTGGGKDVKRQAWSDVVGECSNELHNRHKVYNISFLYTT